MIILRQNNYTEHWGARALTGSLGFASGAYLGSKVGKRIKRSMNKKDLENIKESEIPELKRFLKESESGDISKDTITYLSGDPISNDLRDIIKKHGGKMNDSGSYNHKSINKNKDKVIKEVKEALKKKEDILKNPDKHKDTHEGTGALVGAGLGAAAGIYLGHKLKRKLGD